MQMIPEERAVSEVLGSMLVFGLVLAMLVSVQTFAVPAANGQIEFEHSQRVQGDVQNLGRSVDHAATLGASGSASIEAGVRYPPRFFLLNPAPATGALRMESSGFELENATALAVETADYWDGARTTFDSRALVYDPEYNQYQNAPDTVYEHGQVYNRFEDSVLVAGDSPAVSGDRITLVALDGSLSQSSVDAVSLRTVPVSAPARTVSITNVAAGRPVTLRLASSLPESVWEELGATEPHVESVTCVAADPCGTVTIVLVEGVVYDLRLAKVGVATDFTEEPVHYLTSVEPLVQVLPGGDEVTVEARDRFNNPVPGVGVTFVSTEGLFDGALTTTATTDEHGRATTALTPATGLATVTLAAGIDRDGDGLVSDEAERDRVTFLDVPVVGGDDSDDSGETDINPNETGRVQLVATSAVGKGGGNETVSLTFRSRTASAVDVVGGRINFHSAGGPAASGGSGPTSVVVAGRAPALEVAGEFRAFDTPITIETTDTDVVLVWDEKVKATHFYVVTLEFSNGDIARYFVAHPQ